MNNTNETQAPSTTTETVQEQDSGIDFVEMDEIELLKLRTREGIAYHAFPVGNVSKG